MRPALDRLGSEDEALLDVAVRAAERAARVHRDRSPDEDDEWWEKGRSDFVTGVDFEAQEAVLETIGAAFPDHDVVAEEEPEEDGAGGSERAAAGAGDAAAAGQGAGGAERAAAGQGAVASEAGASDFRWIVDPLDGTTNWLHGYPVYSVSVAVEDDRGLRAGVVLNSATGERFEAVRGAGSRRHPPASTADGRDGADPVPVEVSAISRMELALVGTGFPFKQLELLDPYLEVFRRVLAGTSGVRRAGSAALDLCDLACGRLDAFWELWLLPWDVAAGALIVQEAGGVLEPLRPRGASADGDAGDARALAGSPDSPSSFAHRRAMGYVGANPALMPRFRALVTGEHAGSGERA